MAKRKKFGGKQNRKPAPRSRKPAFSFGANVKAKKRSGRGGGS